MLINNKLERKSVSCLQQITIYFMRKAILFLSVIALFSSCSKQKVEALEREIASKEEQILQLEEQLKHLQISNSSLLDRLSDLSIVNKAGAESIQRSLENMTQQYDFIEDLTKKVQSKDSLNLALVMNLKRSLSDINDEDVQVEVKGGVVYVSISDKLLFKSGSSRINDKAQQVLEKIATVVNDHNELNIMVEGHTDDVPINNSCNKDNWDLSVKRATSVVRVLTDQYGVYPERLTAAGRAEFIPKEDNTSAEGRSKNRRTEIVITPKLDQFFALLEAPALKQ